MTQSPNATSVRSRVPADAGAPRATIVMPLRRQRDAWLRQAVLSAIGQTVPAAVLVVTSDATPSSNLAILREIAAEHPLLQVIQRRPGDGFADAINLGFRSAQTGRVGLLLTDDWLSPDAVAACLAHDADIVCTGRVAYAEDGERTLWSRVIDQSRFDALPDVESKASVIGHFMVFRRDIVLAVGGVDGGIGLTGADDYDLPWTLLEHGATVRLVAEPLYHYRDHDGERLTLRVQEDQIRDLRKILAKHGIGPAEAERLVAAKSRWYGVPCHVAIADPGWSLRPEYVERVRAPATGARDGNVAARDFGESLDRLIAGLDAPVAMVEALTSEPGVADRRAAWKVTLRSGRILKARRLESTDRAVMLQRLADLSGGLPFAGVVGRCDESILEEWVPGPTLDQVAMDPDLTESVGLILGRVARAADGSPLLGDPVRRPHSLWRALEVGLDELRVAGVLSAGVVGRLLKRARANGPEILEAGLVHLDYKPTNIVLTPAGPRVIDNEMLDIGPLDMDLARTWYLWPMDAASQSRFLRGYGRMRSPRSFLLHEVFWAIHTLGCAAAYRHRSGLVTASVVRALERLAAGELPRDWLGGNASPTHVNEAKVRLAFLCDYLAIGGQERICLELIKGLDRSRFEPFVYAFRGGGLEAEFRATGVPVLIGSARDPLAAEREWTAVDGAEKQAYGAVLADALRRDRIDAALVFAWRDALPAVQRAGVRIVIEKLDGPSLVGKIVDKSGFDRVVAEAVTIHDQVVEKAGDFGLDEARVGCILPGIDLAVFDPERYDRAAERRALGIDDDAFVIGTVCRLIPDKNVQLLIRSFAAFGQGRIESRARLLVAGPDGGALEGLRQLARELGIEDRVMFVPATHRVAAILATMDVFALTSVREGLPTVVLEAMAMGLPIVTTGAGAIPEVMESNGFLIPGGGPVGIARCFDKLFVNPGMRRDMGGRSRAIAARFAIRHSAGRYEDLVSECLAENPRRAGVAAETWLTGPRTCRPRVLVVNTRFKWTHIDYLVALGRQAEVKVVVTCEVHAGAIENGRRWGLDIIEAGMNADRSWNEVVRDVMVAFRPDIIHTLYYFHEEATVAIRRLIDDVEIRPSPRLVFECRDPLSTLRPQHDRHAQALERAALLAADGWIFVSDATRRHYERLHGLDLEAALIVPHGFAERTVGPPSAKLSSADGRLHVALVGTAVADRRSCRYYVDIIRRLCQQGVVVHSHFHPSTDGDSLYGALSEELPDYHCHPKLDHRSDTRLSRAMSAYDLMGVFHEFDAPGHNESRTMAVCMPAKAVCGWLLGGIPVVCTPHYGGLVEWIDGYGMGFVVSGPDEVGALAGERDHIRRATRACLQHRHLLTHETQSLRIAGLYGKLLSEGRSQ